MRGRLGHLWRHHRAPLVAFAASVAVTLFFLGRLAISAAYWSDPAHRDVAPQPWMTARYVARSWGVAPEALRQLMDLDPNGQPQTFESLAMQRGVPVEVVLDEVRAHVETLKAGAVAPGQAP